MSFKRILVATDFSDFSDKAAEWGVFLAENYQANLTLLHSIVINGEFMALESAITKFERYIITATERSRQRFKPYLEKAARKGIEVDYKILTEIQSAADSILKYIRESNYDLVVLGTHGRSGLKKWIYGSVSAKIVRLSPIPVLTVHLSHLEPAINKILVPVDFSEHSTKAMDFAIPLARKFKAGIEFFHVVDQEIHPVYNTASMRLLFKADPQLKERSIQLLSEFVEYHGEKAIYTATEGRAYREIVQYAQNNPVDLIVMATRGLTGLKHLLIGSTTERVVQLAPCPVLTIGRNSYISRARFENKPKNKKGYEKRKKLKTKNQKTD